MGQGAKSARPRRPRLRVIAGGRGAGRPGAPGGGTSLALNLAVFTAVLVTGLASPTLLRRLEAARLSEAAAVTPAATYYRDCAAAHADGVFSIPIGAPAYRRALDADDDGIACEPWAERRRIKTGLD